MMAAIRYGVGWKQAGEGFLASLVLYGFWGGRTLTVVGRGGGVLGVRLVIHVLDRLTGGGKTNRSVVTSGCRPGDGRGAPGAGLLHQLQDDRGWAEWIAWAWRLEAEGYRPCCRPGTFVLANTRRPDAGRAPGSRSRWVIVHNAAAEGTTRKGEPAV